MTAQLPSVSVVILNHRRPHLLKRVVHALRQLDYPNFELVVVGDQSDMIPYGLPAEWAARVRYACLTEANICRARNTAIRLCAGEIIAFCDDDAVPEPDWLRHLVTPFASPDVGAVAGTVRAADGLAIEWNGGHFDRAGIERKVQLQPGVQIVDAETQLATNAFLSLMGVNTAFRRSALLQVGGFDEAYRYYLDETDIALRLAEAGWAASLSPAAEVHHLREENIARCTLKVPRNLFEISASKAYFCQRHLPKDKLDQTLRHFRAQRLADLDPYIRLGLLRQRERAQLQDQIDSGLAEGMARSTELPLTDPLEHPDFVPFAQDTSGLRLALMSGWGPRNILATRRLARDLYAKGHSVSCFSYFTGPQRPSVRFDDGIWIHSGGTWRLEWHRDGWDMIGRASRATEEMERVRTHRRFDLIIRTGENATEPGHSLRTPLLRRPVRVLQAPGAETDMETALLRLAQDPSGPHREANETGERLNTGPDAFVRYS